MTEPSGREVEFPDLVFDYDVQLLNEICERLRFHDYGITQFIPTRRSWAAATSEYKNLLNLANPRSHRLFSYSIFPWPYTQLMCRRNEFLSTCLDACFFNRWMPRDKLATCFGHELVDRAVNNRVLDLKDGHLRFNVSFVPFQEYLFVRDRYDTYPHEEVGFEVEEEESPERLDG